VSTPWDNFLDGGELGLQFLDLLGQDAKVRSQLEDAAGLPQDHPGAGGIGQHFDSAGSSNDQGICDSLPSVSSAAAFSAADATLHGAGGPRESSSWGDDLHPPGL
jgi:hypothetical protein